MKLSDLKEAEYNPREITEDELAGLSTSIEEFGDISGIVFNRKTGNLVTGHQRVKALKKLYGDDLQMTYSEDGTGAFVTREGIFKVRFVDWSIRKEKLANIAANNPNIQGKFTPQLQIELKEINLDTQSNNLAKKLLIDKLEIKPLQHDINFNLSEVKNQKANIKVVIGEFSFKIERDYYLKWLEELKFSSGFTEQEVINEIKRRLGIEN